MQSRALTYSGIMHLLLLVFMIFGLPEFFEHTRIEEPTVITVEILPVSEKSNVKPKTQAPKPEPKKPEPKKEEPKPEEKPKPQKPVPKVKTEPEPPKPKPLPHPDTKPKPKPKEKPEPKETKKPEPKKEEDDLEAILRSVAKTAREYEDTSKQAPESSSRAVSDNYDPSQPLTLSEKDLIRNQLKKCWNVPAGAKDAHELVVLLRVQLRQDGSLISISLAKDEGRYRADSFFRAAADSAIRAVQRCTPLYGLPPDKYSRWKDMELAFDPKDMLF